MGVGCYHPKLSYSRSRVHTQSLHFYPLHSSAPLSTCPAIRRSPKATLVGSVPSILQGGLSMLFLVWSLDPQVYERHLEVAQECRRSAPHSRLCLSQDLQALHVHTDVWEALHQHFCPMLPFTQGPSIGKERKGTGIHSCSLPLRDQREEPCVAATVTQL